MLNRRAFIKNALTWFGAGFASTLGVQSLSACKNLEGATTSAVAPRRIPSSTPWPLHEAMFYQQLPEDQIQCQVCFRQCIVAPEKLGFCNNKKNVDGNYYTLIYGRPCALQIDPIEKEPAFHMLPGASILCTGTASCNQHCQFCQNWEMSQRTLWEVFNLVAFPNDVVEMAMEEGCDAVSFTYNEPTVFYEQMYDTARLAKEKGLRALFHTNGTMNPKPLLALLEFMDSVTVDLKAFKEEFYERVCKSELWPVLRTLENIRKAGKHLEIVHLIVPTKNDDLDDIRKMCNWIFTNLGAETPLHFIRFFPAYRLQRLPLTPIETLESAASIAIDEGLLYVYIGNYPGHERNSTFCPNCGERIIGRVHFTVFHVEVIEGRCRFCDHPIPGVWWDT